MRTFNVQLSARGISNIVFAHQDPDFTFFVGHSCWRCPVVIAEFLSPKIARVRQSDATFDHYRIRRHGHAGDFRSFLSLGSGASVEITDDNRFFFWTLATQLENLEIQAMIIENLGDSFTLDNVQDRIRIKDSCELDCDAELRFLASHFDELTVSTIDIDLLSRIVCHPALKILSEDHLFTPFSIVLAATANSSICLSLCALSCFPLTAFPSSLMSCI
jgi:hypothetical protein